jgi:putative copper resistance protein D
VFESPDAAWRLASAGLRIITYAAALVAPGSVLFLAMFRRLPPALRQRIARVAAGFALAGVFAAATTLPVQAGYLAGGGPEGMVDRELLGMLAASPAGTAAAMAAAGGLLLLLVLARGIAATTAAAAGGTLVIAAVTVAGHAAAEAPVVGRALVGLHLVTASFWIGALWPLLHVARHAPRPEAAAVLQRFGHVALVMVGVLVAAGVGLLVLLLGSVEMLWTTAYGRILLAKLVFVAGLLSLAALNRLRLVPRFSTGCARATAALERSIRAEGIAAVLIVTATAVLTTYATPFS